MHHGNRKPICNPNTHVTYSSNSKMWIRTSSPEVASDPPTNRKPPTKRIPEQTNSTLLDFCCSEGVGYAGRGFETKRWMTAHNSSAVSGLYTTWSMPWILAMSRMSSDI